MKIVGHDRFKNSQSANLLWGLDRARANVLFRLLYFVVVVLPVMRLLSSFEFTPFAYPISWMFAISFIVDEIFCLVAPEDDFYDLPMRKSLSLADYAGCLGGLTHRDHVRLNGFRNVLQSFELFKLALGALILVGQLIGFVWLCFAYDCFWDMDNRGDVIRLCSRKIPLIVLGVVVVTLFSPFTNKLLLNDYRAIGWALQLVYRKPRDGETGFRGYTMEVDREAKAWFAFLFINLLSVGVGYRAFLLKVPYGYGR